MTDFPADDIKMEEINKKLLKQFKPILIVYYPYEYNMDSNKYIRLEALKAKLGKQFFEHYFVLFIPHAEDSFKLDLLSVLKSTFIKDKDLKKYIDVLQTEILDSEKLKTDSSDNIKNL